MMNPEEIRGQKPEMPENESEKNKTSEPDSTGLETMHIDLSQLEELLASLSEQPSPNAEETLEPGKTVEPEPERPAPVRPKKKRKKTWLWFLAVPAVVGLFVAVRMLTDGGQNSTPTQSVIWSSPTAGSSEEVQTGARTGVFYAAGTKTAIPVYDEDGNQIDTVIRGSVLSVDMDDEKKVNGKLYYPLADQGDRYMCQENLAETVASAVTEYTMLVKTTQSLRTSPDGLSLGGLAEKNESVTVTGCDWLYEDGTAHMYQVKTETEIGYLPPCYLTTDTDEAKLPYDQTGLGAYHLGRGDLYGGGKAGTLDYYPREKLASDTNPMPERCYTLYLNTERDTMELIDEYIEFAKSTKINAFVVDIMDGSSVAYPSDVYAEYSPSANEYAINTQEQYGEVIQKLKDNGFYVIGRITAFNDYFFAKDHPECAIVDGAGELLELSGTYWPSAYSRYAWEYKVALAKEAVELFGFHEIQYDYVRFPDGTYSYDKGENIDYHNTYQETKAQAIQRFLMFACDVLHDSDAYVSADVFGETSNPYVAAYGQYFPAISNVVDVISGMPYPDHYEAYGDYLPWEHPYEAIDTWAKGVVERQSEIPTPAIVRTWIQAYDAIRAPYNEYGAEEIAEEIAALVDNGLTGGFITWNAGSSYSKYLTFKSAFDALE